MKTRLITKLTALTLTAFAGAAAHADEPAVALEWQQPGYVTEVVVVTAKRPDTAPAGADAAQDAPAETAAVTLASQQPGYVEEVVVVRASRSEVLARARAAAIEAAIDRKAPVRSGAWSALGTPAR